MNKSYNSTTKNPKTPFKNVQRTLSISSRYTNVQHMHMKRCAVTCHCCRLSENPRTAACQAPLSSLSLEFLVTREMQIKTMRHHLTPVEWLLSKENKKCCQGCEEIGTVKLFLQVRIKNDADCLEKFDDSSKKLNIELPFFKDGELKGGAQRDTCIPMFTAHAIHNSQEWKQPTHPPMDEWINRMYYILGWSKVLFEFSIPSYRKIQMSILANSVYNGSLFSLRKE